MRTSAARRDEHQPGRRTNRVYNLHIAVVQSHAVGVRTMAEEHKRASALARTAALAVLSLGACQLDSLLKPPRPNGPSESGSPTLERLVQTKKDSVTEILLGGSAPERAIVVSAVVRDTSATTVLRLEVEVRPIGTEFQGVATAQSASTSSGMRAYALVGDLADGTSYHWQARVVDATDRAAVWQSYGANPEHVADVQVASPPPPPPPPPTRLAFTSEPTTVNAGATMSPVRVALVDAQNNPITGFTGSVVVRIAPNANPGGDVLTRSANAVAGVATFSDVRLTKAGIGYRLEAAADGFAAVTSASFGVNPGPAHHPKFRVQPSNTTPNTPITPAVIVEIHDVYGNIATGFTGVVYMDLGKDPSIGGATLEGSGRQRAAAAGVVTYEDLKIDKIGVGYTIIASTTNVHAEESAAFNVLPLSTSAAASRPR